MSNSEFKEGKQATALYKPKKLSTPEGNKLTHRRSQPYLQYLPPELKTPYKLNSKQSISPKKKKSTNIVHQSKTSLQKKLNFWQKRSHSCGVTHPILRHQIPAS